MNAKPLLLIALSLLTVAGIALSNLRPVAAAPVWTVSLDANSTSQTDIVNSTDPSPVKSFRIGAIVNATVASPINNVFGWQFTINYNASAFVPQGDPNPGGLYPDGAFNTVLFGAQTTTGTVNWAGLVGTSQAFGSSIISSSGSTGQITVFLTLLAPTPAVTISAKNLLANLQFEFLNKPTTTQLFTISNVVFTDNTANFIPGISSGTSAAETITNAPPVATFTSVPAPQVGPFAIAFDSTLSSDSDGTIANPAGYFWDFGDGTQDLGVAGPLVTHDFGGIGTFNVTLRVQDDLGATGSARDSLGNAIVNSQPSHFRASIDVVPLFRDFAVKAYPSSVSYLLGNTANSTINVSGFNGFSGSITLSATVAPSVSNGPTFNFNPPSVFVPANGSVNSTLTLAFSNSSPLDEYDVTVSASNSTVIHTQIVSFLPTTMRIQPGLVTGVSKGSTFTVNVAASVAGAIGWQFTLHYDPALLSTSFRSVSFGPFWQNALDNQLGFPVIILNQTRGSLQIGFTLLAQGNVKPAPFIGNATFASIIFTANAYDNSSMHLSDFIFVNSQGGGIPVSQVTDGVFDNRLPHDVAVTSVAVLPTTVNAGGSVTITVVVKNRGLNSETMNVAVTAGGNSIGQQQVSISSGELKTLSFTWDTPSSTSGTISIQAQATISTGDGDGSDNTLSTTAKVNPQPVVKTGDNTPSYLLYGGVGAVAAIAAIAAFLFLRRRKAPSPTL